ncbi:hypothetical protein GCM10011578_032400 [Streptomyces fuscichromogenes]|uniref:Uncharacterized protein n=1 Tax=Streptomyces fuscichromogenes TaxID=1324013 RepID=A0A918CRQ8_9ACTN|nr:hypothetical protein GCM10011578_032400 [Streptomyces fuscichromogenes]
MPTKATRPATAGVDMSSPCSQSRFLVLGRPARAGFTEVTGGPSWLREGAACAGSTVFTVGVLFRSCRRPGRVRRPWRRTRTRPAEGSYWIW